MDELVDDRQGSCEDSPCAPGEAQSSASLIKLVVMVGFHHSKGHQVEWAFPAPATPTPDYRHLAMLCLPEGAHTVEGLGHVFFTIELALTPHEPRQVYFGVSVFGQLRTADVVGLLNASSEDKSENKRSHVQKGVAALSREPSFWWLHGLLRPAVENLFAHRDFSRVAVLEEVVRAAGGAGSLEQCVKSLASHHELSKAQLVLVQRFGRNTLLLVKLLLLEPRVVLYAGRCQEASSLVLALVSLVPQLLQSLSPALQLSLSLPALPAACRSRDDGGGSEGDTRHAGERATPTTPISIRYVPLACTRHVRNMFEMLRRKRPPRD